MHLRLVLSIVLALAAPALAQRGDRQGEEQPELPADLVIPPAPPLSPAAALGTFRLAEPDFTIALAAAEPMIADPVAAVFDADGRLWVVEMQSYMPDIDGEGELAPTSRIVVLDDEDGDWVFDSATTFMDGLVLPRSVLPCYGGALVLAPPKLLFARDTDGDGAADEVRELLDGFGGLDNPEHAGNGLLYGLDNWIHFSQHGLEIRFDGETVETRRTPGHGQWGITQDDWGRLYYAPNSDVLRGDLFPKHEAARNPNQRGVRGLNATIAPDRSVYPARMNPGINRGYQEPMLRDDYTLARMTAACSPVIYRSAAWGDDFYHNAFVCEPAGNCLKRVVMSERSGLPHADNAYDDTEFLTSTDERFRPVAQAVGPDGSLFVVDMYRGVIQHKTYVTTFLRRQVEERGLEEPIHLGRVWRVQREGAEPRERERMTLLSSAELVERLRHPDSYFRMHAQRILVERRATDVSEQIREILHDPGASRVARVHAVWTLAGLGRLATHDVRHSIGSGDPAVLVQALRLGGPTLESGEGIARVAALTDHDHRTVRLHAALALGESRWPEATEALADALLEHGADPLMRTAILTGLGERETVALAIIAERVRSVPSGAGREAVAELADCAVRGSPAQRTRYVDLIAETLPRSRGFARLLLDRLGAEQRLGSDSPRSLALASEPAAWRRAVARGMWDMQSQAAAVTAHLTWPGNDGASDEEQPLTLAQRDLLRRGQRLFDVCAACHGYDGAGMLGQAPPLAGSDLVLGRESRLARVVMQGLAGPIEREGVVYDAEMPPAPFESDEDIAAILTYVRRSFGNRASPVSPGVVGAIRGESAGRASPWTEAELMEVD